MTSSVGRLFDAVAALAGVRDRVSHEGQAAMELEWLASEIPPDGVYPFDLRPKTPALSAECCWEIDCRPMIRAIADESDRGVEAARIARRFHSTIVALIEVVCDRIRAATGLRVVVLSGGVFMNALLSGEVEAALKRNGFCMHRHFLVPPNDGGLSLGQLAIAAACG